MQVATAALILARERPITPLLLIILGLIVMAVGLASWMSRRH